MSSRPLTLVRAAALATLVPLAQAMGQTPPAKAPATAKPVAPAATAQPTVSLVKVVGIDYSFQAPDNVSAGIVTFNLVNSGSDLHAMAVFELPSNHTLKEFLDQYHAQGMIPVWMVGLGQTTTIAPQAETFLTVRMKPGKYILACLIPARDGRMHTEKGMVRMLMVK